eukprot:1474160-Prymnesium_polylepis.1
MPLQAWATGLKASVCVWLYFWIRSTIDERTSGFSGLRLKASALQQTRPTLRLLGGGVGPGCARSVDSPALTRPHRATRGSWTHQQRWPCRSFCRSPVAARSGRSVQGRRNGWQSTHLHSVHTLLIVPVDDGDGGLGARARRARLDALANDRRLREQNSRSLLHVGLRGGQLLAQLVNGGREVNEVVALSEELGEAGAAELAVHNAGGGVRADGGGLGALGGGAGGDRFLAELPDRRLVHLVHLKDVLAEGEGRFPVGLHAFHDGLVVLLAPLPLLLLAGDDL